MWRYPFSFVPISTSGIVEIKIIRYIPLMILEYVILSSYVLRSYLLKVKHSNLKGLTTLKVENSSTKLSLFLKLVIQEICLKKI